MGALLKHEPAACNLHSRGAWHFPIPVAELGWDEARRRTLILFPSISCRKAVEGCSEGSSLAVYVSQDCTGELPQAGAVVMG